MREVLLWHGELTVAKDQLRYTQLSEPARHFSMTVGLVRRHRKHKNIEGERKECLRRIDYQRLLSAQSG